MPPPPPTATSAAAAPVAAGDDFAAALPVLSLPEVMRRLQDGVHAHAASSYRAMYSSVLGGLTTDPAAMVVNLDDHMCHRGHAVFDTATIWNGYLYELDAHLDRILRSAASAKVQPPFPREHLRSILMRLASVSGVEVGHLRFWLSAGPGGFLLTPKECVPFAPLAVARPCQPSCKLSCGRRCIQSAFYAISIAEKHYPDPDKGVSVVTSTVPIKPPEFATVKSVNYLPNALMQVEAEEQGAFTGIWLDQEGYVAEGPNMNVAFVDASGAFLIPPFDRVLAGCTAKRLIQLAAKVQKQGLIDTIRIGRVSVKEARAAPEMMLIGSGTLVTPVVEWDRVLVGSGLPGKATLALRKLMQDDMELSDSPLRIKIATEAAKSTS
eukprot:SM000099S25230  [mRNA]  locus=s99:320196:322461:- [translate_table: standard]